jgi:hypothetical protein
MKPPPVSVVIPCFNAGKWIAGAIESALAQTLPVEVIVVDDGSRDDSIDRVRGFGNAVHLLVTEHRGGNFARNTGWRAAAGEWVQFLDADDYLEPRKIAVQLAAENTAEADLIYSPVWIETGTGEGTRREASILDPDLDLLGQWILWQLPQTGGALWRRASLDRLDGWKEDQPCCQEHELYLRALLFGCRFALVNVPHAVYRIWSSQTVCRRDPALVVREKTALLDQLRSVARERGSWTEEHEFLAGRTCFEMARTLAVTDLERGAEYARDRQQRGLFQPAGPAASARYRTALRCFGFRGAERLARWLRRSG